MTYLVYVMDYVIGDGTLSVTHHHEMPVKTTAGALQSWEVTITSPAFTHISRIGIASPSYDVTAGLVATIVDVGMLTAHPGSSDNDPFAAANVRAWIAEHRTALEELVADLRG